MSKPNYDLRVSIPEETGAWKALVEEIPKGADLQAAHLVLTPRRVSVSLTYRGRKPGGESHQRFSHMSVSLDPSDSGAGEFIRSAFGKGRYSETFVRLLPTKATSRS